MANMVESPGSAHQKAYTYLRGQIESGSLKMGSRVKTEEIAAVLGMSRMPVREAVRQLETEGLLVMRPNRGAVVVQLDEGEIRDLFEIRAAVEGLVVRSVMGRLTADDWDELEFALHRLGKAEKDPVAWFRRHEEFHSLLINRCGRPRLAAEATRLRAAVAPYLRLQYQTGRDARSETESHRILLEALRTGDADKAEAAIRDHVLGTIDDLQPVARIVGKRPA